MSCLLHVKSIRNGARSIMNKGNVLNLKSTLLLQSIVRMCLTVIITAIALFLSINFSNETILIIGGIIFGIGIISFFTFYIIKESIEDKNTANMISWVQTNYGIRVNRKQAIELVRYGNAEFGSENHMIQLSLVERNGSFSLHKTQEIKTLKETE